MGVTTGVTPDCTTLVEVTGAVTTVITTGATLLEVTVTGAVTTVLTTGIPDYEVTPPEVEGGTAGPSPASCIESVCKSNKALNWSVNLSIL